MLRPWDTLESMERQGDYYGARSPAFHPLRGAPPTEARGGVVYFDDNIGRERFDGLLKTMGANARMAEYSPLNPRFRRRRDICCKSGWRLPTR